jgi:hypothetical protein
MNNRPFYHYHYWSKRQTRQLAEELSTNSRPRWRIGASGGPPFLKVDAQQQDYSPRIDEVAARIEASGALLQLANLGDHARVPHLLQGLAQNTEMLISFGGAEVEFAAAAYILVFRTFATVSSGAGC